MDKPTDDSIEVAITLLKECGEMLNRVIPKGLHCKYLDIFWPNLFYVF